MANSQQSSLAASSRLRESATALRWSSSRSPN